jgi:SAM-dependent methyltransferase
MSNSLPAVLDACCGPRMMWFNKSDPRALFVDKRRERVVDETLNRGNPVIVVDPDLIADFTALPFADSTFALVVFDPPHTFSGKRGWMAKKYGSLSSNWREEISAGFRECFRVLCPGGTLIFKWNEHRVPVSTILSLTKEKPLFGQRVGATAKTHWIVFQKALS